jgi:hypothetical protein
MARCPGTHRRERRWDPAWAPAGAGATKFVVTSMVFDRDLQYLIAGMAIDEAEK